MFEILIVYDLLAQDIYEILNFIGEFITDELTEEEIGIVENSVK